MKSPGVLALLLAPTWHSHAENIIDTAAWPKFPLPSEVLIRAEERGFFDRVLQQTTADLAANHARKTARSGPYVWIEPTRPQGLCALAPGMGRQVFTFFPDAL